MSKKRFLVEVEEPALCCHDEIFGTMLLPCGSGTVTANDIKVRIEKARVFETVEDLYFSELRGNVTVTELPDAPKQEANGE